MTTKMIKANVLKELKACFGIKTPTFTDGRKTSIRAKWYGFTPDAETMNKMEDYIEENYPEIEMKVITVNTYSPFGLRKMSSLVMNFPRTSFA